MTNIEKVEAIKGQTFGVEIECYGVPRKTVAARLARFFGTGRVEQATGRDEQGRSYTRPITAFDQKGRAWKVEHDGSIEGEDAEVVSPILTVTDLPFLKEVIGELKRIGLGSDAEHGCGVHIHVGGEGHTAQSLINLVNLMASKEDLLTEAIGVSERRTGTYCRPVDPRLLEAIKAKKPKTVAALEDIWYTSQGEDYGRENHGNRSRYHMLNLHSFFHGCGTVEFRLFELKGLDAERLEAFILLALSLNASAKLAKTTSSKKVATENRAFAMRTWLNRMGWIGPEFASARRVLTKDLPGNQAWASGTPHEVGYHRTGADEG